MSDHIRRHTPAIIAALSSDHSLNDEPHDRFQVDPNLVEEIEPFRDPVSSSDPDASIANEARRDELDGATFEASHDLPSDVPEVTSADALESALGSADFHHDSEGSTRPAEAPEEEPAVSGSSDIINSILKSGAALQTAPDDAPVRDGLDRADLLADGYDDDPDDENDAFGHEDFIDTGENGDGDSAETYLYDPSIDQHSDDEPRRDSSPWWRRPIDLWHGWDMRRRTVAGASALTILIIVGVVIAVIAAGGSSNTGQAKIAMPTPNTLSNNNPATSGDANPAAADSEIKVQSATARCPAGSTNPMQAFDDNPNTAWVCVRAYGVDGQVLVASLPSAYIITSISIVPGFNAADSSGQDQWVKHRTVARVKYTFNDTQTSSLIQSTQNIRDAVVTPINPPVLASKVSVTILSTASSTGGDGDTDSTSKATDFAVSSIVITGHKPS